MHTKLSIFFIKVRDFCVFLGNIFSDANDSDIFLCYVLKYLRFLCIYVYNISGGDFFGGVQFHFFLCGFAYQHYLSGSFYLMHFKPLLLITNLEILHYYIIRCSWQVYPFITM